ncbi:putative HVA22-like protein g [Cucurbita pepo subsp. pepo]|uniref:putative HVA22-like protein g n=1 Tax=Cucurbita pepo subsp. pepo TaxID=3664 RepID=UPI000C9D5835|nr:putative HVA22-like protein g [Cucurbita pepo subsp. pepo]
MFGVLITRCLLMVFGYAYPAFECYKTLEKSSRSLDVESLRFWCKYWIIVAIFTFFERIADVLIAWLPVYGEMKLLFLVYLWHPKTKGSGHVYGTMLQPYLAKNEAEIERMTVEMKVRAWDLSYLFWTNFSEMAHAGFLKVLKCAADFQSAKFKNSPFIIQQRVDQNSPMASPPPPNKLPSFSSRVADKMTDSPRGAPQSPVGIVRGDPDMTEADGGQSPDFCETESFVNEEDKPSSPYPPAVRARLRRIKPQS